MFLNVIINATHAIAEGDVEGNEIRIRTGAEGDDVWAEVRDTGKGIPPENLGRLFDPFFTTKEIGVGSGLGLSISKNIIEGYGGSIKVESVPGKGTSFFIRIPIGTNAADSVASTSKERAEPQTRGRILIVDDEDGIRSAMKRMLRGHDIVEAPDGLAAKGILEGRAPAQRATQHTGCAGVHALLS